MTGRAEEDGLSCTDPIPSQTFLCVGRPADATAERLNIGVHVLAQEGLTGGTGVRVAAGSRTLNLTGELRNCAWLRRALI